MANSQSACPICSKAITDSNQEKCDKCHWTLNIENSLSLEIRNSLVEWAICHYQRSNELDKKDFYNHNKIENRLNRQRDDIDRLQQTIDSFINKPEIKSILLSDQITTARNINISEVQNKDNIDIELNKTSQQEEALTPSAPVLTQIEKDIISEHDHNIGRFAEKYQVKAVNLTKESINANWGNEEKNVVLEESNRGNYWIFNLEDNIYLVPAKDIDVDPNTYTTTSTIFECHKYRQKYDKIQLIKPATVRDDPNTNPQTWRLQEQGELEFK